MWECRYGKEPLNTRLFILQLLRKLPVVLLAAVLGVFCVGGPYFLVKVTFGPAKEYEAITDFYIDYALQADGTQHTYINFATWDQLVKDDVFTDRILLHMAEEGTFAESEALPSASLEKVEKAAGITKKELQGYLSATVLSDTRIATTTVRTNDPALTMRIERAFVQAMIDFGEQQKEIANIRILQEPEEASLVVADVRTFRACMVGLVSFVFITVLYLCLYYTLDESIRIPETFERRFGIPMLGTIRGEELPVLAKRMLPERASLVTADKSVDLDQVKSALAERGIETGETCSLGRLFEKTETDAAEVKGTSLENEIDKLSGERILLIVKAGAHNGKQIEKALDFCRKYGLEVSAALLWGADEKLIKAYEAPEHVFHAWRK